jgi:[ribosomal protein S18]-alanine N-acetyltransferase
MEVRELTTAETATIAGWRYPGRYSTYDFDDPSVLARDHWAVVENDGTLVGVCCFGAPARVDGAHEEPGVLDVGYGMAPDLMGEGRGHRFVEVILAFALEEYRPERLRLYILDWNGRSRRTAERHGFEAVSYVENAEGRFLVMVREPALPSA